MAPSPLARPFRIEACVVSVNQAVAAAAAGADRLELCREPDNGGQTPGLEEVREICRLVTIPVRVLIRSTTDGFEANPGVLEEMLDDIRLFTQLPVEGFVFGVMQRNRVDAAALTQLVEAAGGRRCTFHKAIDTSTALEQDIAIIESFPEIDTLLTSGGADTALEGIPGIRRVSELFRGTVMAAGRITPGELPALHAALRLSWYHGRAITGPMPVS